MENEKTKKIAVIRIVGQIGLKREIKETLNRLGLKRKYHCTIIDDSNAVKLGMVNLLKDFVAFGNIGEETYKQLVEKRGKNNKAKDIFRMHPPRGGIKSKIHFPKGVLGNNKEHINKLIERML